MTRKTAQQAAWSFGVMVLTILLLIVRSQPSSALYLSIGLTLGVGLVVSNNSTGVEAIKQLTAARDDYIEYFRVHGEHRPAKASELEGRIQRVVEESEGEGKARALFELATIRRLTSRFEEAIETYTRTARNAKDMGLHDLEFDAWLGIARSHAYGTRNHGAAAAAFSRAVASAGAKPTPKQGYEMADYASQLQAGRGELEAALVNAIEANRLARTDAERLYAQLDAGDVLQKFAESCDYRKLIDAKTSTDEGDSWGACRRAVGAAKAYYEEARETAKKLAWDFLVDETEGFISRLGLRLDLIEQKASFEKLGQSPIFTAQDVRDVLVNEDFSAGASAMSELSPLGGLIEDVISESQSLDPRSLYLLGIKADLDNEPKAALKYFDRASALLQEERATLFDPRRRGTVIENRPELVRDLALRLLALGELERAFEAFESIRARGLSEFAGAYKQNRLSEAERHWLADLIQTESHQSAILSDLVETTVAGVKHSKSVEMLEELNRTKQRRRELLVMKDFEKTTKRLASAAPAHVTLAELQAQVRKSHIPVLLYWVTHTNVVVWVISPSGMEVKTVFLPEVAVIDKVGTLVNSIRTVDRSFNRTAAQELHTYLIQPFADHLTGKQVLIVPQGPLVTLPFEALIDTRTGEFLVESMAVSYAPTANFAARVLQGEPPPVTKLTAIYDEELEQITGEISRIGRNRLLEVTAKPAQGLSPQAALGLLGRDTNIHILLHGKFDQRDPLQSQMSLNNPELSSEDNELTAAELLAVDWGDTRLAVFSSCEGAMMNIRISNEVYGMSWAPLIGGVDHVLVSRWRVQSDSNADWMSSFYDSLASRKDSPALAAAAAMREMIARKRSDPFYWAGMQVFGR